MSRRKSHLMRFAFVAALLSMLASYTPAFAAHADGTASVNVRNVLAGETGKAFSLTVNHASGSPIAALDKRINYVIIAAPTGFLAVGGTAPTGWQALKVRSNEIHYFTSTDGTTCASESTSGIASGGTATFGMTADVPVPSIDKVGNWFVQVSSDCAETAKTAAPTAAGTLTTTTRILEATSLSILSPAGATDASVTEGQSGVASRCRVFNHSNVVKDVSATLKGSNFTATTPASQLVAPKSFADFDYTMSFGSPSSPTATCEATSSGATTQGVYDKTLGITIQPKAALGYTGDSLTPKVVPPGTNTSFSVRVDKTPGGSPSVILDQNNTTLTFQGPQAVKDPVTGQVSPGPTLTYGPVKLATPVTIGAGAQSGQLLTFATAVVPPIMDGAYTPTILVSGTDQNDTAVSTSLNVGDKIRIDASIPSLTTPTLDGPASQVPNQTKAVKNGDTLSMRSSVSDIDPQTGNSVPCGKCTIVSAQLVQFADEAASTEIATPINVTLTNTNGDLSGSYTGSYAALAQAVILKITVADEAGHKASAQSAKYIVDNVAPYIKSALASAGPETAAGAPLQRQVVVEFSEPVAAGCTGGDWRMEGNAFASCKQTADLLRVELIAAKDFEDDMTSTSLTYMPLQSENTFHDRVGLDVPVPSMVPLTDGIAPLAPTVNKVAGAVVQDDGRFWTNQESTSFELTGDRAIRAGYTGEVWGETNGVNGLQRTAQGATLADTKIGSGAASGTTLPLTGDLTAGDLPETDGERRLYAVALDQAKNVSVAREFKVFLDNLAPAVATVAPQTSANILITLTDHAGDKLAKGRNFIADWAVYTTAGDRLGVGQVKTSGSQIELVMNSNGYSCNGVGSVEFLYLGPAGSRYEDRATNQLGNFLFGDQTTETISRGACSPVA